MSGRLYEIHVQSSAHEATSPVGHWLLGFGQAAENIVHNVNLNTITNPRG